MINDIIVRMFEVGCFQFGRFKLTSGRMSPYYIDLRRIISYPDLFRLVLDEYRKKIIELDDIEYLVGIETGSIPITAVLSYIMRLPMVYVRKRRKDFGGGKLIEGYLEKDAHTIVIEDVVTTGGSIEKAVKAVRNAGGSVEYALAFIDRLQGGADRLSNINVKLISITNVLEVMKILMDSGKLSPKEYEIIVNYVERGDYV